eukprot:1845952-Rhodomonas_salina.1
MNFVPGFKFVFSVVQIANPACHPLHPTLTMAMLGPDALPYRPAPLAAEPISYSAYRNLRNSLKGIDWLLCLHITLSPRQERLKHTKKHAREVKS